VIATYGTALGQVFGPDGLVVDGAGNLYVADTRVSSFFDVLVSWEHHFSRLDPSNGRGDGLHL
jgi:hypothetical protein